VRQENKPDPVRQELFVLVEVVQVGTLPIHVLYAHGVCWKRSVFGSTKLIPLHVPLMDAKKRHGCKLLVLDTETELAF